MRMIPDNNPAICFRIPVVKHNACERSDRLARSRRVSTAAERHRYILEQLADAVDGPEVNMMRRAAH